MESTNSTLQDLAQDNTTTFIVGFGILLIFVLLGILASAFLCMTLKKDPYLWEAERERQLHEKENEEDSKDKINLGQNDDGVEV